MKTKSILLFALAVVMLLGTSEAMAQECTLVQISGSNVVQTPYKIAFVGVTPCTNCGGTGINGFQWDYQVTSSPGSITQLSMLTPVCSQDLGIFVYSGGQILAPGIGDSTTMFGVGDFQYQVDRLALNASPHFYLGVTRDAIKAPTSMQIRVSRNLYYCPSILGPECGLPSYIPKSGNDEKVIGSARILIQRDPGTGCGIKVFVWQDNAWVELQPETVVVNSQNLVNCGDLSGNQRCQECVIFAESSPGYCYLVMNGKQFKVPGNCYQ